MAVGRKKGATGGGPERELAEARAQQAATADILKVIAASPSDVRPVFDAIASSALALIAGSSAFVVRRVGDQLQLAAHTATTASGDESLRKMYPMALTGHGVTGKAVLSCAPTYVSDFETDSGYSESVRAVARARGTRSMLAVPMMRDGAAIGVINVTRSTPGPFTDHQTNLLKIFADQAVIAIENVRLFNETRESLERQTATAEILKVIASSPDDVQPVFDAIARSAVRLIGGHSAAVRRLVGDELHIAAFTSTDVSGDSAFKVLGSLPLSDGNPASRAARAGNFVFVEDMQNDPAVLPELREVARARGYRSSLAVPMSRDGVVIGVIGVTRKEPGEFTGHQIGLLNTFADQAVIAIENVRLFNETREALERQTATAEILKVIATSPSDVQPVFIVIVSSAVRLIGGHSAIVTRIEGDIEYMGAYTSTGPAGEEAVRGRYPRPLSANTGQKAIETGAPQVVVDYETDPSVSQSAREYARARGYRSNLIVPLLRGGSVIGTIRVTRKSAGPYPEHQIRLLQTFADQAVIAIENVRLFNETKEALERQTATAEILRVIASSPSDVQPVFEAIVASALRLVAGTTAHVTRLEGDKLHLLAYSATDVEGEEALKRFYPISIAGTPTASQQAAIVTDVETDTHITDQVRAVMRARGVRSAIRMPIVSKGSSIGAIVVNRKQPGPFPPHEIELLRTFASQAVIAIENVRLFNETRALEEERLARLKSFFSPQLAELLAAGKGEELLKTHRREITVQFFDLRGFTAFTGAAEPEEVMELLSEFHSALGCLIMQEQGTIERFAGDSVMVFFNDPLPVERPAERAMRSALAMMRAFDPIAARWKKRGHDLGLGAGIAQGYATLGAIGFEGRRDYAAIGPVTNLAARLCAEAKGGQILADQKTVAALDGAFEFDALGELSLKGFAKPVSAFALRRA